MNLKRILKHKYLILLALLLAVIISAPALWRGWGFEDDIYHRTILLTSSLPEVIQNLFIFIDPETTRNQMEIGQLPWWTLETTQIKFFRPLAGLTFWLDYQLWPDSSTLMHAHNLVWYLGICALAAVYYRRLMGNSVSSGLAILLFALNIPHVNAVYSIAARSQLLGTFFGILTLWAYDRSVRDKWKTGIILGPIFLALGVFSAEAAIAILGYLIAYAFFIDSGEWMDRLMRLLPYFLVVVAWRLFYNALGYGVFGSGFYLDPFREPFRFSFNVLKQLPILLLGQWVLPDPVLFAGLSTVGQLGFWLLAILVLVFLALLISPVFGNIRRARFWSLGMLLAMIPICGTSLISGRHLLILSLGAIALMSQYIASRLDKVNQTLFHKRWKGFSLVVAIVLLSFHGIIYPIMASTIRWVADPMPRMMDLGPLPGLEGKDLIVLNSPTPGQSLYLLGIREVRSQPVPEHLRILGSAHTRMTIRRLDPKTLSLKPEFGFLVPTQFDFENEHKPFPLAHIAYAYRFGDAFFRDRNQSMTLGEVVELPGMKVEVFSLTVDGRPWEIHLVFEKVLEDPSLSWLAWDWETESYLGWDPPNESERTILEGPFEPRNLPHLPTIFPNDGNP